MTETPRSFFGALLGDGRPLLLLTAVALAFAGGGALFLACTGDFLPHDVVFLGMQPTTLCALNECRIVHFMIHDRASFGAVLISLATIYAWLALFPIKEGETWAWCLLVLSYITGFGSFLCYLGYGYLDTWHGWATILLLPVALLGLVMMRRVCITPLSLKPGWTPDRWLSREGIGRAVWLTSALGLVGAGSTIMWVGMTDVFVPSDLAFIGYRREELEAINPRLIPLIAHDRAGFGGGVFTTGLLLLGVIWKARPSIHAWQAIVTSSAIGFAVGVGVHYPIGYMDVPHLLPAWTGAAGFFIGALLSQRQYFQGSGHPAKEDG